MKREVLFIFILLGILTSASAFAQSGREKENTDAKNFHLDLKTDATAALVSGIYLTPDITASYKLGPLALGAQIKYSIGFRFGDSYLLGMGIMGIGPFYIGGGFSAKMTAASDSSGTYTFTTAAETFNLGLTTGLIFKPIPLGPGKLGFNAAIDLYPSDTPIDISDSSSVSSNFPANLFTAGITRGLSAAINLFKINIGINYTLMF